MRAKEFLAELGDKPYILPKRWQAGEKSLTLPSGSVLKIDITKNDYIALVNFYVDETQDITGQGDAFKIFSTVNNAVSDYVRKNKPEFLVFTGNSLQQSRIKLYDRMVSRWENDPVFMRYENITDNPDLWPDDLEFMVDDMQDIDNQKLYVLARF